MGNILALLRYGQTGADSYGLIDNLNLTYNGNQLESVYDNATTAYLAMVWNLRIMPMRR